MAVWIAVLAVPRTRDYARYSYGAWTRNGLLINLDSTGSRGIHAATGDDTADWYRRLLPAHPKDKNLLRAIALAEIQGDGFLTKRFFMDDSRQEPPPVPVAKDPKPLHLLSQQFPEDPFPIAVELQECVPLPPDKRTGGPLTNPNFPGKAPPERPLTAEEKNSLLRVISLAHRGQQLDANNTYFDWCLISALLELHRDREALKALEIAAHKSGFNDFSLERMQAHYYARSLNRAQAPAEAVLVWDESAPFAFWSRSRQVARHIMELAIAARQRGDKAAAVHYGYNGLRLGRIMRLRSQSFIGVLVAEAVEGITILAVQPPNPAARRGRSASLYRTDNLAGLAQVIGQPQIAGEVMAEWKTVQKYRAAQWPITEQCFGVPSSVLYGFRLLDRSSVFIFDAARWIFPLWLLLLFSSLRFPSKAQGTGVVAFRGGVWGAIGGLVCAVLVMLADLALQSREAGWQGLVSMDYGSQGLGKYASWWIAGLPLIVTVWLALIPAARRQRSQIPPPQLRDELTLLGAENRLNLMIQRVFPVLAKLSVGLAILAGLIWYFGFLPADEENFRYSSALVVALGAGLWLSQFLGILRRPRRRETLRLALSTMLYAFGGYLVAVWLCLGLVLLAALPGLRNFDTQFQRTLREGEMPVYRSLAGL